MKLLRTMILRPLRRDLPRTALTVLSVALGVAVLELHMGLPEGLDHWTERLIGLTLIVLGIGVVAGILRKDAHGHSHGRIESRLAIAKTGAREGDIAIFLLSSATEVIYEGEKYYIVPQSAILMLEREEDI